MPAFGRGILFMCFWSQTTTESEKCFVKLRFWVALLNSLAKWISVAKRPSMGMHLVIVVELWTPNPGSTLTIGSSYTYDGFASLITSPFLWLMSVKFGSGGSTSILLLGMRGKPGFMAAVLLNYIYREIIIRESGQTEWHLSSL